MQLLNIVYGPLYALFSPMGQMASFVYILVTIVSCGLMFIIKGTLKGVFALIFIYIAIGFFALNWMGLWS